MADLQKASQLYGNDITESVIDSKDLLDYLDTVEFLTKIFKKVENNVENIDSNTLYEIYYHKYKLGEIVKDAKVDTLVRKEAEGLLSQLQILVDLIDEDKTKKIYESREDTVKVEKQDKIKYAHNEKYDGLASQEISELSGDFLLIVKNLILKTVYMLVILGTLYFGVKCVPVSVRNIAELASIQSETVGDSFDIVTNKANMDSLDKLSDVIQVVLRLIMTVVIAFEFMQLALSMLYINLRLRIPWNDEARNRVKSADGNEAFNKLTSMDGMILIMIERLISQSTIEDCDNYIKHVRIKKRIHVADRIERNLLLLDELEEYANNNSSLPMSIIEDTKVAVNSTFYKTRYDTLAYIEYLYETLGIQTEAA